MMTMIMVYMIIRNITSWHVILEKCNFKYTSNHEIFSGNSCLEDGKHIHDRVHNIIWLKDESLSNSKMDGSIVYNHIYVQSSWSTNFFPPFSNSWFLYYYYLSSPFIIIFFPTLSLANSLGYVRTYVDKEDFNKTTNETRKLGLVVVRGTQVSLVSPEDGMEEISNPFLANADE